MDIRQLHLIHFLRSTLLDVDVDEKYQRRRGASLTASSMFSSRTRGHPWNLKKKRINTDLRYHYFSDRVINWWNKLDHDVVCATSVNAFKNRLQRIWERDEFVFGPIVQ